MPALTAKQKWLQFILLLTLGLGVGLCLNALGSKAAWLGALAACLWALPCVELRTTRRQPKHLTIKQLKALGITTAFVAVESIYRFPT